MGFMDAAIIGRLTHLLAVQFCVAVRLYTSQDIAHLEKHVNHFILGDDAASTNGLTARGAGSHHTHTHTPILVLVEHTEEGEANTLSQSATSAHGEREQELAKV